MLSSLIYIISFYIRILEFFLWFKVINFSKNKHNKIHWMSYVKHKETITVPSSCGSFTKSSPSMQIGEVFLLENLLMNILFFNIELPVLLCKIGHCSLQKKRMMSKKFLTCMEGPKLGFFCEFCPKIKNFPWNRSLMNVKKTNFPFISFFPFLFIIYYFNE